MMSTHSRGPKLLKGALIQFTSALLVPIPNVIVFQYNPESLSRSLSPFEARAADGEAGKPGLGEALTQPYDPTETFNLTLLFDASDALEDGKKVAELTGVADRISALEMLLYPSGSSLLSLMGNLSISLSASIGGGGASIKAEVQLAKTHGRNEVPVVLFVWGPGRIVPVRLTSFTVDEQQYNHLLYPHRARVTIGLRVVLPEQIDQMSKSDGARELAKFAYQFTRAQKEALALANVANTVESILGILPF